MIITELKKIAENTDFKFEHYDTEQDVDFDKLVNHDKNIFFSYNNGLQFIGILNDLNMLTNLTVGFRFYLLRSSNFYQPDINTENNDLLGREYEIIIPLYLKLKEFLSRLSICNGVEITSVKFRKKKNFAGFNLDGLAVDLTMKIDDDFFLNEYQD